MAAMLRTIADTASVVGLVAGWLVAARPRLPAIAARTHVPFVVVPLGPRAAPGPSSRSRRHGPHGAVGCMGDTPLNSYQTATTAHKLRGQYYTPEALIAVMLDGLH